MESQKRISINLTKNESKYLEKISIQNGLTISDNNKNPSEGKALKFLINKAMTNEKEHHRNENNLQYITKLIEQINVSIPHLIFNTTFNYKVVSNELNENIYNQFKTNTINSSYKICGQIQSEKYHNLYISTDNKNMKTIPIEDEKNTWK